MCHESRVKISLIFTDAIDLGRHGRMRDFIYYGHFAQNPRPVFDNMRMSAQKINGQATSKKLKIA